MATITAVETITSESGGKAKIFLWETMAKGDEGSAVGDGDFSERSVQVTGTFDGEAITIQGSNDGTNWSTLTDLTGTAITFAGTGLKSISEITRYIRPVGDNTAVTACDLDVTLYMKKI